MSPFTFVGKTAKTEWVLEKGQLFVQHPSDAKYRVVQIDFEEDDHSEHCMFTLMREGAHCNWNYAMETLDQLAEHMNKSNWSPVT